VKFKLIIVMTEDDLTDRAIEVARAHGATGCTVISSARGEGLKPAATFLGLTLEGQRDMIDIEDAIGLRSQIVEIEKEISEEEL